MAQITLYLDDNLLARMRETAAASRVSQSQFVTNLIREALHEQWPQDVVLMAGALPGFPTVEGLRAGDDNALRAGNGHARRAGDGNALRVDVAGSPGGEVADGGATR